MKVIQSALEEARAVRRGEGATAGPYEASFVEGGDLHREASKTKAKDCDICTVIAGG